MCLRVGRDRFLSRSIAALLALLVCGGALDWGHIGGDDRDCDIVIVHHDHAAHRLSTAPARAPASNDHCYICHSLRLLHHAVASRYEIVAVALGVERHSASDLLAARDG